MTRRRIVAITGPTASGKSALGLRLAEELGGEIINADSVQVYRELDIGSAKPGHKELARVKHHLISVLDPSEQCDAGRFAELADTAIAALSALPIVVGGSGLYLQALLNGLVPVVRGGSEVRERIERVFSEGGTLQLHSWLSELDELTAAGINPHDVSRVRRALEVILEQGLSLRELQQSHQRGTPRYDALVICLLPQREKLYTAINRRVDEMVSAGLIEEVSAIVTRYGSPPTACLAIGYRQTCAYLAGEIDMATMVELIKRDTRRFAKRQLTWWRHQPERLGWTQVDVESQRNVKGETGGNNWPSLLRLVRGFIAANDDNLGGGVHVLPLEDFGFGLTAE